MLIPGESLWWPDLLLIPLSSWLLPPTIVCIAVANGHPMPSLQPFLLWLKLVGNPEAVSTVAVPITCWEIALFRITNPTLMPTSKLCQSGESSIPRRTMAHLIDLLGVDVDLVVAVDPLVEEVMAGVLPRANLIEN